jgi:GNAT superfamily N-acetyltransferase
MTAPEMLNLRSATAKDAHTLFLLILALAEYEHLSSEVTGSVENLEQHLFSQPPLARAMLAEIDQQPIGFALYFYNYSTFRTQPGIYLEDLFVLPAYRRQGVGTALLKALAQIALEGGCGRMEWSVLDWNRPAIAFYEKMGATVLPDWRICRTTGHALAQLAQPD